jgi:hypothetical protein
MTNATGMEWSLSEGMSYWGISPCSLRFGIAHRTAVLSAVRRWIGRSSSSLPRFLFNNRTTEIAKPLPVSTTSLPLTGQSFLRNAICSQGCIEKGQRSRDTNESKTICR